MAAERVPEPLIGFSPAMYIPIIPKIQDTHTKLTVGSRMRPVLAAVPLHQYCHYHPCQTYTHTHMA